LFVSVVKKELLREASIEAFRNFKLSGGVHISEGDAVGIESAHFFCAHFPHPNLIDPTDGFPLVGIDGFFDVG
jgi:hypothetical protein